MITSIALILLLGLLLGKIFIKLGFPSLLGMIITGMILGPFFLDLIDTSILNISGDLRKLALVIILTRAGLSLDISELKKVGRPAILMCFLPALFEIVAVTFLAPLIFEIGYIEAALMGTVLAAVSPAVIVPRMIRLIDEKYGTKKAIPQLILAGASVDDVFVIVLFTVFSSLSLTGKMQISNLVNIPVSIILGILFGSLVGFMLVRFFKAFHMRDTVKILIIISVSGMILEVENLVKDYVAVSGLLAIMSMGIAIYKYYPALSKRLSIKYNKLWIAAEIFLFVLVGASVNPQYALKAGPLAILLVLLALLIRMLGVATSLIKTNLDLKEKVFCMIAYTPKATVQAAIGGIPLALGIASGELILTIAVLCILITAPIGAFFVDRFYKKLLKTEE